MSGSCRDPQRVSIWNCYGVDCRTKPAQTRSNLIVMGNEGSLTVPDEGTTLIRQRYDDESRWSWTSPVIRRVTGRWLQRNWYALIADFVGAVRDSDQTLHSRPDLP